MQNVMLIDVIHALKHIIDDKKTLSGEEIRNAYADIISDPGYKQYTKKLPGITISVDEAEDVYSKDDLIDNLVTKVKKSFTSDSDDNSDSDSSNEQSQISDIKKIHQLKKSNIEYYHKTKSGKMRAGLPKDINLRPVIHLYKALVKVHKLDNHNFFMASLWKVQFLTQKSHSEHNFDKAKAILNHILGKTFVPAEHIRIHTGKWITIHQSKFTDNTFQHEFVYKREFAKIAKGDLSKKYLYVSGDDMPLMISCYHIYPRTNSGLFKLATEIICHYEMDRKNYIDDGIISVNDDVF